jgi:alkylhydroperoxidase family enzyme
MRMQPLEPPYAPEVAALLDKLMPSGTGYQPLALFRLLALNPELASRALPLASGLLNHGRLSPREREIVVARTTAWCGAEYEWGVHAVYFAQQAGLSRESYDALAARPAEEFEEPDRRLIIAVDELLDTATMSSLTLYRLLERYSDAQVIELILLAGWYRTLSTLINAAQLPPETWAARFPVADHR